MYKLAIVDNSEPTAFDLIPKTDVLPANCKAKDISNMFNLDSWEAEKVPNHNEVSNTISDSNHIRRSDNGKVMAKLVSNKYEVLQYPKLLTWLDPFLMEGLLSVDSALMLNDGAKFSVLSNIGVEAKVTDKDSVSRYLLLAFSHDGGRRGVYYCDVRPVCANTLHTAMMQGLNKVNGAIELNQSDPSKSLENAKKLLNLAERNFHDETMLEFKAYDKLHLEPEQVDNILRGILNLPLGNKDLGKVSDNLMMQYNQLKTDYKDSPGMELIEGDNGWKVLNAVTYFQQSQGKTAVDKFTSSAIGGASLRRKTTSLLNDLLPKSFITV